MASTSTPSAAIPTLPPPLDETVFSQPALLHSWGGLSTDNILFYLSHSPFYDPTSNNAVTTTQAQFNPALAPVLQTRRAFEAHLRSMAGLEFVVAHDPTLPHPPSGSGVSGRGVGQSAPATASVQSEGPWVIRKQNRSKDARGGEDRIEVLAEYFVVGDRIFQAPTMGAVLGTRLLGTARALGELVAKAGSLARFTAARGHGYPPSMARGDGRTGGSVNGSPAATATAGGTTTGEISRTSGIDGDSDLDQEEQEEEEEGLDQSLLLETLMNHTSYAKIYMDENPLVGEPGNFRVSKNGTEVPLRAPINGSSNGTKGGTILPALTVKTDLASVVVAKKEKEKEKEKGDAGRTPVSANTSITGGAGGAGAGAGSSKKKKKDRTKGLTPKEVRTPISS